MAREGVRGWERERVRVGKSENGSLWFWEWQSRRKWECERHWENPIACKTCESDEDNFFCLWSWVWNRVNNQVNERPRRRMIGNRESLQRKASNCLSVQNMESEQSEASNCLSIQNMESEQHEATKFPSVVNMKSGRCEAYLVTERDRSTMASKVVHIHERGDADWRARLQKLKSKVMKIKQASKATRNDTLMKGFTERQVHFGWKESTMG